MRLFKLKEGKLLPEDMIAWVLFFEHSAPSVRALKISGLYYKHMIPQTKQKNYPIQQPQISPLSKKGNSYTIKVIKNDMGIYHEPSI